MRSALLLLAHHLPTSSGLRELPKLCPECLPETLETDYFQGQVSEKYWSKTCLVKKYALQVCLVKSLLD